MIFQKFLVKSVVNADDTTLFHINRNIEKLTETLHGAELCPLNWFTTNGLLCNNDKTPKSFFHFINTL